MVEARDLSAISSFSLYQSLMSLSFKTQVESTDRLPNVVTRVLLQRDGFKTQKRKTMVEKETSSPLWNQLFYFDEVEVAEGELDACSLTFSVAAGRAGRPSHSHNLHVFAHSLRLVTEGGKKRRAFLIGFVNDEAKRG